MPDDVRNLFVLNHRVAVITGGAQGIGAAIANALAAHGATTVLLDTNFEAATTMSREIHDRHQTPSIALACDVCEPDQVDASVAEVVKHFERIDVLINNASIHRRVDPTDYSQSDVDDVFRVNLLGSLCVAGRVGRIMIDQQSGSIVNLSALGGGIVGLGRGGSAYGITKGGIVALTRDLAAEWGKYNIRVNALAPGWIRTPMTHALQNHPTRAAKVIERVPLKRWGEADDVAGAAVFLASDASRYVTGHTIPVDGGAANVIAISED